MGHYVNALNLGERLALPAKGLPRRDLLHVNDLATACTAFADSVIRHGLYNLGGGMRNTLTLRELIAKLEELSGLQAVIDEDAEGPAPVPMNYVTDLGLVTQELDWSPKIGLDEGLKMLF